MKAGSDGDALEATCTLSRSGCREMLDDNRREKRCGFRPFAE